MPGIKGGELGCVACAMGKLRRKGHGKVRASSYKAPPFSLLSVDFFGPLRESYRGRKYVLVVVDSSSGYTWLRPADGKFQAPALIKSVIEELRLALGKSPEGHQYVHGVRSDNEPVFRSEAWMTTLKQLNVVAHNSVPYHPQGNGNAERLVSSAKSGIRAMCWGTDLSTWCYAAEMFEQCLNAKVRKGETLSPAAKLRELSTNPLTKMRSDTRITKHGRRFGCLAFAAIMPRSKAETLGAQRFVGVNLGLNPRSSSWLIGSLESDRLVVRETMDVVFREDVLVRHLPSLALQYPDTVGDYKDLSTQIPNALTLEVGCPRLTQSPHGGGLVDNWTPAGDPVTSNPGVKLGNIPGEAEGQAQLFSSGRSAPSDNASRPLSSGPSVAPNAAKDPASAGTRCNSMEEGQVS